MTPPVRPIDLSDADLYEHFRDRGLSHEKAVIQVERRRASRPQPPPPQQPSVGQAALVGGAQGATSGFADELVGALSAVGNPNIPLTSAGVAGEIGKVRDAYSAARSAHPVEAFAGNIGGAVVNPASKLLGPLTKGLSPTATGATYGATLGGAQGFGEAEGGFKDRAVVGAISAAIGGTAGAAGGFVFGKLAKPLRQMWQNIRSAFQQTEQQVARAAGPKMPASAVREVQEAAHRAYLQKQGFPPNVIDMLMEQWRAGGLPKNVPVPPPPPTSMRPGETLTPIAPKGFEVTGTRATPPVPTAPTILEMQTGQSSLVRQPGALPDIGTGKTLPYYPRGGRVEQALGGPAPAVSPSVPGAVNPAAQANIFAEFLKGATPQDLPNRIGTLRALGVPIGPAEEAQLVQMLITRR